MHSNGYDARALQQWQYRIRLKQKTPPEKKDKKQKDDVQINNNERHQF